MRLLAAFAGGLILGAALLFVAVTTTGGWYTYETLPRTWCETSGAGNLEVVPHQPNPCHFRRPRFGILP